MSVVSRMEDNLVMRKVYGRGRSVFATEPFKKSDYICEYAGEHINHAEAMKRYEAYGPEKGSFMYFFQYRGNKYCVDATGKFVFRIKEAIYFFLPKLDSKEYYIINY